MKRKKKKNKFLVVIVVLLVILFLLLQPLESYCPTNSTQSKYQVATKEEVVEETENVFIPNLQADLEKVMQMESIPFEQPTEEIVVYENPPNDINTIETGIAVITFGAIVTEVLSWTLSLVF